MRTDNHIEVKHAVAVNDQCEQLLEAFKFDFRADLSKLRSVVLSITISTASPQYLPPDKIRILSAQLGLSAAISPAGTL